MLLSARLLEGLDVVSRTDELALFPLVSNAVECCRLCCSPVLLSVSSDISPGIAPMIVSDRQLMLRCVMNLLNNACQHTEQGSIRLVLELTGHQKNFLRFSVFDTGHGHDPSGALWVCIPYCRYDASLMVVPLCAGAICVRTYTRHGYGAILGEATS